MRIDPVFLVAPKPVAPSMPTRRAFLLAGSTFAVGVSFGGACGYAVGAGKSGEGGGEESSGNGEGDKPLPSSGNVELDELRRLAVQAPMRELNEFRVGFLREFSNHYRNDQVLWRGVERLCKEVIARTDYPNRKTAATLLAQVIELGEPGLNKMLGGMVPTLRSLR